MSGSVDEVLAHFGVKGMKWGVRRAPRAMLNPSDDHTRTDTIKKKSKKGGTKSLSNKELQDLITRMNLEQQYNRLNPSKIARGLKAASTILGIGATVNQAIAFANSPTGKLMQENFKRKK